MLAFGISLSCDADNGKKLDELWANFCNAKQELNDFLYGIHLMPRVDENGIANPSNVHKID